MPGPNRNWRAVRERADLLAARSATVLDRFLAGRKGRTRSNYLEALDRIAALYGKRAEQVAWHSLRSANVDKIIARMAVTHYSANSMRVTMVALRNVLRQAHAEGLMTDAELEEACRPRPRPWALKAKREAQDAATVAERMTGG
jgi:hypothetical protein